MAKYLATYKDSCMRYEADQPFAPEHELIVGEFEVKYDLPLRLEKDYYKPKKWAKDRFAVVVRNGVEYYVFVQGEGGSAPEERQKAFHVQGEGGSAPGERQKAFDEDR